jgi:hypothetical protein
VATTFAAILLSALLAIALLVIFRIECTTWALRKVAAELPFETADFRVVDIGLKSSEFEIVQVSSPGWTTRNGKIRVNYTFNALFRHQTIDKLHCSGLDIVINCDPLSSTPSNPTQSTDSVDFETVLRSIFTERLSQPIPLDRLTIEQSTLEIVQGLHSETVALSAQFDTVEQTLASGTIDLKASSGSARLSLSSEADHSIQLQLTAQLDAPTDSLSRWVPNWQDQLNLTPNDSIRLSSIEVDARTSGELETLETLFTQVDVTLSDLDLQLAGNTVKSPQLKLHIASQSTTAPNQLALTVESEDIEGQVQGTQIIAAALHLKMSTARSQPFEWVDLSAQSTLELLQPESALKIKSEVSVNARTSSASPIDSLSFDSQLESTVIEIKEQQLKIEQIQLSGNPHEASGLIPAVRLNQTDAPYLTNTQLNIDFSSPFAFNTATLQSIINAQTNWPMVPLLKTSELNLEATLKQVSPHSRELTAGLWNTSKQAPLALQYGDQLLLKGNSKLQLHATANNDLSDWQAQMEVELNQAELEAANVKLSGLNARVASNVNHSPHLPNSTIRRDEALQAVLKDLEATLTWEADALHVDAYELGWPAGAMTLSDGLFHLNVEGSQLKSPIAVTPKRINVELTVPFQAWPQTTAEFQFDTQIDGSLLAVTGNLKGDFSTPESPWIFDASWAPFEVQYSDIVSRLFPSVQGLALTATLSGQLNGTFSPSAWDASLTTRLTDGAVDLPASQIKADGIEGTITVDSLQTFTSSLPASNQLDIQSIQVGGLQASNTQLAWAWLPAGSVQIQTAQTSLFGGTLKLSPSVLQFSPLDIDSQIHVSELSLNELGIFFDLFNGKLEGSIEGRIPFTFRNDVFLPKSTQLRLPRNTEAKLHYVSDSLKQSLATESPYLLKSLKLEPSTLITNALSDLTITQFQVNLFSQKTPEIPLTIHIAGHGLSGETTVPLVLDIPIKGSLEELYILLLRLHRQATTK